jgi:D-aminopeptidase
MLSHPAACALIREKAQRAWERLAEFKPFDPAGPVEIKVEFTTRGEPTIHPREGVERLNERTWLFRGRDIVDAWLRWSSL